jgi:SAM-dependent methyltransferase
MRVLSKLTARRDKVLNLAELAQGETLLDVGCGEGLIAFGALERGAGRLVFSDISRDLLHFCGQAATDLGVRERWQFIEASADDLAAIDDGTIDVVTTRSVLIYVANKRAAFVEWARVLRPGGRISLFRADQSVRIITRRDRFLSRLRPRPRSPRSVRSFAPSTRREQAIVASQLRIPRARFGCSHSAWVRLTISSGEHLSTGPGECSVLTAAALHSRARAEENAHPR